MTAWTDLSGTSGVFLGGGWAADLGVYTGPTADMPPPPVLPSTATEIDFIVGTPNPDGLVEHFHDHSYPEPDGYYESGVYRYHGTEHPFDGGPITASGLHLFIVWYGSAPDVSPESVVPVGWSSGGTLDIGHWSEWQGPLIFDHPGAYQDGAGAASSSDHYYVVNGGAGKGFSPPAYSDLAAAFADVPTVLADAVTPPSGTNLLVGLVSKGGNFAGGTLFTDAICLAFFAAGVHASGGSEFGGHLSIGLDQWVATVVDPGYADPTDQPAAPAPLAGLTFGVDYGYIPGTTDVAQYEDPAAARVGWLDWDMLNPLAGGMDGSTYNAAFNGSSHQYYADYNPYISFRHVDPADLSFEAIYGAEVGGPGASGAYPADVAWPAAGIGTELSRLNFSALTTGPAAVSTPIAAVPLADVTDAASFTMVAQPSAMLGDVPPTHAPSSPDANSDRDWETEMGVGYTAAGSISIPPPRVRYSSGRWRYWIPAVSWHTVGGHFSTPGVAGLKILTPGHGWVSVVDGPA